MKEELTAREIQILPYLRAGLSNRDIGKRLEIAAGTVAVHVTHIKRKLGGREKNRAEFVLHIAAALA